jgi:hypothetical protein
MADSKQLAPAVTTPAPSPAIAAPAKQPAPQKKARHIPRKIVEMTDLLLDGRAKNVADAARQVGCSREYLSRTLSERPDCVAYMQQRAARTVGVASAAAAARMASLIHAGSEHVAFRASEHVLGVSGIKPAEDARVSVNIELKAGYVIDLRGRPRMKRSFDAAGRLVETPIEDGRVIDGAVIVDVKPIEPADAKPKLS